MQYVGKLKHLIVYPVQHEDGKVIVNVAAFVGNPDKENTPYSEAPGSASCSQEEILGAYAGWEPEVQALLQVGKLFFGPIFRHLNTYIFFFISASLNPRSGPSEI